MFTPTPILLGATTEDGLTLTVTGDSGGLSGYVLTGQSGPAVSIDVSSNGGASWAAATLPYTLLTGTTLRLTRLDPSVELSTIRALAPITEDGTPGEGGGGGAEPYTVTTAPDGYQTIDNAEATTDMLGYQFLPDATATTDPDDYESVERS